MLINCVALKELSIYHLTLPGNDSRFVPASILDSLEHLNDTLESLTLIDENGQNHSIAHSLDSFPLPRITGFNKLNTIETTADLLLGQALVKTDKERLSLLPDEMFCIADFPKSIVRLTFREMRADTIQYLMWSDSDLEMPNLKEVHVQFASGRELNDDIEWLIVATAYRKRGIALSYSFCGQGDKLLYPNID